MLNAHVGSSIAADARAAGKEAATHAAVAGGNQYHASGMPAARPATCSIHPRLANITTSDSTSTTPT